MSADAAIQVRNHVSELARLHVTQCSRECTSMPAACGCVICKSSANPFLGFPRRADDFVVRELFAWRLAMLTS
jgi:hypothetical protein